MARIELPHIVLVIMDSVAAKRCSVYGHQRRTTPGLERLAGEGVLYRHCFSPSSWTLPSHVSLFSGLYPRDHGCNIRGGAVFPNNYYTLAEILRGAGYRTIGISSNGFMSRDFNFNCGFDEFYEMGTLFNTDRFRRMRRAIRIHRRKYIKTDLAEVAYILRESLNHKYYSYPFKHLVDRIYRKSLGNILRKSSYATERALRLAKRMLKKYQQRPNFIFINFMEAHVSYNPPRKYHNIITMNRDEADLSQLLHEQEIAYLDDRLSDLYTFLKKLGLAEQTLFIVTSDHGDGFGEHGLFGHVFGAYNELVHIPLIVKYPAAFGLQGESRDLVQLHDLFTTLLEVAGSPVPGPESSRSLLSETRAFALVENLETAFAIPRTMRQKGPNSWVPQSLQPCLALVDRDLHKLIYWADGRRELYDLKGDYGETLNLEQHPAYRSKADLLERKLAELSTPAELAVPPELAAPQPAAAGSLS
jgi:arylsulfatase A-like enzyme